MSSYHPSMLLKGGVVLIHGANGKVEALRRDLLIRHGQIDEIATNIQASTNVSVIDCTDKIISPGFIDTHHHVWQTLLKGRHGDELLIDYMPTGNMQSFHHSPEDIFWGELGGCVELLQAGVTTVLDHAHLNYSPEHNYTAISATVSSGIRSVFCYNTTTRLKSWDPLEMHPELFPKDMMDTLDELIEKQPFGDGRVTLGFANDVWFLPKEATAPIFEKVNKSDIKTISIHGQRSPYFGGGTFVSVLMAWDWLDHRYVIAHGNKLTQEELDALRKKKACISTTPSTELQMALGSPVAFDDRPNAADICSVGVDCHSATAGNIVSELRIGLQAGRGMRNDSFIEKGKVPKKLLSKVVDAFNLGTIKGARTLNMEDSIGSIAKGKRADLVIWDALSPAMVCAAQQDPVSAIVLHSSPADIDTVIVDGRIVKQSGKEQVVRLDDLGTKIVGSKDIGWRDISKELVKRRETLQATLGKLDMDKAKETSLKNYNIAMDSIVDSV